jgi:hypothetical protein
MRKITTNKKILSAAVLAVLLCFGLIFTTCGKLETDDNVYTVTFIAVYSVMEERTETRKVDPKYEDIIKGEPIAPLPIKFWVDVYYDAFTGREVDVAETNQGVSKRTDKDGRLTNFPPNPGRSDDYIFDGWWTTGGTRVTEQTIFTTNTRVKARWKAGASIQFEEGDVAKRFAEIREDLAGNPNSSYTVTVGANESLKPQTLVSAGGKVTITLDGGVIDNDTHKSRYFLTISESGSLFTVGDNVTLVLKNVRMEGNDRNTGSLLTVNAGGKLIIGDSGPTDVTYITLNGSENERAGGGVTVNRGGELIMKGGDIYQCSVHARPYDDPNGWPGGGGVNVRGGTFTMEGGNIERCFGSINGGGVLVDLGGIFTMTGGQLYDNSAPYGGGASTYRGGLFILDGGVVKENLAREGGGIFVDAGAEHAIPYDPRRPDSPTNDPRKKEGLYIISGSIQDNHALYDGGGIYNFAGGIVYMTGGTIGPNNIGDDFGGGVMNMGLFIMMDGLIRNNRASYGAGVMAGLNQFAMEAGTIINNGATSAGGGVFVLEGTFSMLGADALIDQNVARVFGGGLAIYPNGVFAMAGGTLSRNSDQNYGEGTIGFFDSTDPKLLGFALFGKRPDNYIEGDPLMNHRGHWWTNPNGAKEWLIDSYLVDFRRDNTTKVVTSLLPIGNSATVKVTNGELRINGSKPGWVTFDETEDYGNENYYGGNS